MRPHRLTALRKQSNLIGSVWLLELREGNENENENSIYSHT